MTAGSVMREINFLAPRQWGQIRTSISKARFINSAHVRHRFGEVSPFECGQSEEFTGAGTMESLQEAAGASTPW